MAISAEVSPQPSARSRSQVAAVTPRAINAGFCTFSVGVRGVTSCRLLGWDFVGESDQQTGRVFLSYTGDDTRSVDELQEMLEAAGVQVWRDIADLWPGEDWRIRIRKAITNEALVFIACFSARSVARTKSYQNEELTLAIDELRQRPVDNPWLIPVRFDDCAIPDREIGGGRTFSTLQRVDLFGPHAARNAERLTTTVLRTLRLPASQLPALPAPAFGIITALPEEFVAMRALIDNPQRLSVAGDRADYVLGTMPSQNPRQPHQVVLTLLGETGNDAASSGCANLIRSFGSVRCVLMTGIAAGVPSPADPSHHVRLGDVVVARWGIAEYDSVTDQASGPVRRRTFPAASPLLERRARMLEVGEITGQRPWEEWLTSVASQLPGYARPPESTDVLYESDETDDQVPHPDVTLSGHRPGWPKVHPGVIASGDRSLRSARKSNEIAATAPDVLAIEMEGKGIGNTGFSEGVEWLVVRGISDYGDHHVNRVWRNYASLAAAAYARALLAECPPAS
jgi:nucleoside phosphorylase